jgi:hypothetical protein
MIFNFSTVMIVISNNPVTHDGFQSAFMYLKTAFYFPLDKSFLRNNRHKNRFEFPPFVIPSFILNLERDRHIKD